MLTTLRCFLNRVRPKSQYSVFANSSMGNVNFFRSITSDMRVLKELLWENEKKYFEKLFKAIMLNTEPYSFLDFEYISEIVCGLSDRSWKIILYRRVGSKASQKNYQKFCPATIWLKAGVGGSWSSLNSADESSLQGNDQPSRPLSSHSQLFWSHSQLFFCIPEESNAGS